MTVTCNARYCLRRKKQAKLAPVKKAKASKKKKAASEEEEEEEEEEPEEEEIEGGPFARSLSHFLPASLSPPLTVSLYPCITLSLFDSLALSLSYSLPLLLSYPFTLPLSFLSLSNYLLRWTVPEPEEMVPDHGEEEVIEAEEEQTPFESYFGNCHQVYMSIDIHA
jgi:hypothetical protein